MKKVMLCLFLTGFYFYVQTPLVSRGGDSFAGGLAGGVLGGVVGGAIAKDRGDRGGRSDRDLWEAQAEAREARRQQQDAMRKSFEQRLQDMERGKTSPLTMVLIIMVVVLTVAVLGLGFVVLKKKP